MRMNSRSITIVDDDEAVRHSLQALLEAAGLSVDVYPTGEDFLASADAAGGTAGRTSCLILDLHLPGLDGVQILERLRDAGDTTPVILISARFDPATRVRADRAGALVLLEKPLREAALLDGIERALGEAIPASRAIA
jgi:FixJ family two-component response regulator